VDYYKLIVIKRSYLYSRDIGVNVSIAQNSDTSLGGERLVHKTKSLRHLNKKKT